MFFLIGFIVVLGSVLGGYVLHHGKLSVLYQPTEYLIIMGAGIGAFLIANPSFVLKATLKSLKLVFRSAPHSKKDYLDLLMFMYSTFKFIKTKGMLEFESHLETPYESDFFKPYPSFTKDHHAVDFFCDTLKLVNMGVDNKYELEEAMDFQLEQHHYEKHTVASAVVTLGDSFPALGIVAAVLGVIVTMGSITEPPEILGGLIGAALVGTFLGILISYGFVGPMGQFLAKYFDTEHKYYECIKIGILASVQGKPPTVAVEYARRVIPSNAMPSFQEVEEAMNNLANAGGKPA